MAVSILLLLRPTYSRLLHPLCPLAPDNVTSHLASSVHSSHPLSPLCAFFITTDLNQRWHRLPHWHWVISPMFIVTMLLRFLFSNHAKTATVCFKLFFFCNLTGKTGFHLPVLIVRTPFIFSIEKQFLKFSLGKYGLYGFRNIKPYVKITLWINVRNCLYLLMWSLKRRHLKMYICFEIA